MTPRHLVALAAALFVPSTSRATLDPEPTAPYVWRVVVHFVPHPLLTRDFRGHVRHAIRAALAPALGEVGKVEVVDLLDVPDVGRDPLTRKYLVDGWSALDAVEFRQLTGVKTHVVRVSVVPGGYRVEARQHDGLTGLASPVVRQRDTASPETVARIAGLVLGRELGPVGTIELIPDDKERVRVRFRGSALPGFDRLVTIGDVCAVSTVREQTVDPPPSSEPPPMSSRGRAKQTDPVTVRVGQPREYTLVRAEERSPDGTWTCRVLTQYANPFKSGTNILGYRCLKLATVDAPVRVRVVDAAGNPQPAGQLLQVRATDRDFAFRLDARDALELRDGVFRSARPLHDVACLEVSLGARRERFPVPVLGEGPVTVRFVVDPTETARAAFERECLDLRGRVADARTGQLALVQAVSNLIVNRRPGEALERADTGLRRADAVDKELIAELERLKGQPGAADRTPSGLLAEAERLLGTMRVTRTSVASKAKELADVVARSNDPTKFEKEFRAKELTTRIRELVAAGEVPEALDRYDQLIDLTQLPEAKDQKARLAKEWEPHDSEHAKARDYVAGPWRAVTTVTGYRDAMNSVTDAYDELARNGDRLGLRALLASFEPTYGRLKEVLDKLDANSETDRAAVKELQTVADRLRKLEEKTRTEVAKLEAPLAEK